MINPHPAMHGGCLITDILQEAWPEDWIPEAMVLSPGEAIPFFGRHSKNEGLSYHRTRYWARRSTQIEASRKTMPEGCCAILKAVVEKKMKARGPG